MRQTLRRSSLTTLAFAACLLATGPAWAGAMTTAPAATSAPAAKSGPGSGIPSTGGLQRVSYAGLQLDIPQAWTIVDLTAHPTACVRFDVHVVYLGTPGAVQDCPSVVEGRTDAILLRPMPVERPYGTMTVIPGAVPNPTSSQLLAGEVIAQVSGTGILMTAAFGTDPAVAQNVFRSLTVTGSPSRSLAPATTSAPPSLAAAAAPAPLDRSFTWYYGKGFDACTAPALSTMKTWRAKSPYRSIGIYIGGNSRGCSQANLTAGWVRSVASMGWKAQPIYVGRQAPCSTNIKAKMTPGQEWTQGRASALDAIAQARALGIGSGSDIYYDMEAYPQSASCSGSVRAFLSSWTAALLYNGYSSGVYSSAGSGIADLANSTAMRGLFPPNKIWIALWNGRANVDGAPYVAATRWSPYQRMHQYRGGHVEVFGNVGINIDNNYLDTDSNRGSPFGQFDTTTTGPGTVTARGWAIDPDIISPIMVQMYIDGSANALTWANQPRPDVGSAYPADGPNHGYSLTMQTTAGPHRVCLYAINSGPGTSRGIGCRNVNRYSTYAYVASSRVGRAVYVNTLVKQNSKTGLVRGSLRVSYLQRYIGGTWQNMLARTADTNGQWTVGFVQAKVYQYRIITSETRTARSVRSANTIR